MNPSDYGKYNTTDMLLAIQDEMELQYEALTVARKNIEILMEKCEEQSLRILCLEMLLEANHIPYENIPEIY